MQAQDPVWESKWKGGININSRAEVWTKTGVGTTIGSQVRNREDFLKIKALKSDINWG